MTLIVERLLHVEAFEQLQPEWEAHDTRRRGPSERQIFRSHAVCETAGSLLSRH